MDLSCRNTGYNHPWFEKRAVHNRACAYHNIICKLYTAYDLGAHAYINPVANPWSLFCDPVVSDAVITMGQSSPSDV